MNTSDKLAFAAIGISVFTAIFAWYSFSKTDELSKNAFNRNYRPYVFAGNFAYIDKNDGKFYPNMNMLLIKVLNAPGYVTSKKLSFYTRDNNIDTLLFEHPEYKNELIYPTDNNQIYIGTDEKTISHTIAQNLLPKTLIRKVTIEYQWVSDSTIKYFFKSEWAYNLNSRDWDLLFQDAN